MLCSYTYAIELDLWHNPTSFTVLVEHPNGKYLHSEQLPEGATEEEAMTCIRTVVELCERGWSATPEPFPI